MSTEISARDVEGIALLARLTLSPEEVTTATNDLSRVLDHFSALQSLDTKNVAESTDVTGRVNVAREDVAAPDSLTSAAKLLSAAPATRDTYVKVPAVF